MSFLEARGKGHVMGVTLGVLQNSERWFGEGDDMVFIDNQSKPSDHGYGNRRLFLWSLGFWRRRLPFHHLYNGAPYIAIPEHAGGRYCLYRWHADNPIAFQNYIKHTIEHGHADDRGRLLLLGRILVSI